MAIFNNTNFPDPTAVDATTYHLLWDGTDNNNRSIQYLFGVERSADPPDPPEGMHFIWQSNGIGSGNDGDVLIKVTAGGATKIAKLFDFTTMP